MHGKAAGRLHFFPMRRISVELEVGCACIEWQLSRRDRQWSHCNSWQSDVHQLTDVLYSADLDLGGEQPAHLLGRYIRLRDQHETGRPQDASIDDGADLNAVKELLGHSSLAATQVYTHNTIGKLKDIHKKAHPKA